MRLSVEEQDLINQVLFSEGWGTFIKAIDLLIEQQASRVCSCPDHDLLSEKKKYEGMKSLKIGIESLKKGK